MASAFGGILGSLGGGVGSIGRASVDLVLNAQQYNAALAGAEVETAAATKSMQAAQTGLSKAATTAWTVAGIAVAAFVASSVKAAIDAEQVLAKLNAAVDGTTAAYQAQATALQDVTGFQDELILSADTVLTRFKLTEDQIQQAIPTILDYARATGKDVPDAAKAVGKALIGNTRALKEVGITFTATGRRGEDFAAILDLLNAKVGGTAEAFGKTTAGQLAIANARFDDVKETIGAELLPVIVELTQIGADLAEVIGPILVDALDAAVKAIQPAIDGMVALSDAVNSLTGNTAENADGFSVWGTAVTLATRGPVALVKDAWDSLISKGEELEAQTQADALKHIKLAQAITGAKNSFRVFQPAVADLIFGEEQLGGEVRATTKALEEQKAEMRLLVGGQIGLAQAAVDVKEAQQANTDAVAKYGPKSREAKDAAYELVDAQLELKSQLTDQNQALRDSGATLDGLIAKFDRWALALGISKTQLAALNRELDQFNGQSNINTPPPSQGTGNPNQGGVGGIGGGGSGTGGIDGGRTRSVVVNVHGDVYGDAKDFATHVERALRDSNLRRSA